MAPTIGELLTRHARDCDELHASAKEAVASTSWPAAEKRTVRLADAMWRHVDMQEEILFRSFDEAVGLTGRPVRVGEQHGRILDLLASLVKRLCGDHRALRDDLIRMRTAAAERSAEAWLSADASLAWRRHRHDTVEEGIFHPMAEHVLAQDSADIVCRMSDILKRPGMPWEWDDRQR